jgi:hypothetical protein
MQLLHLVHAGPFGDQQVTTWKSPACRRTSIIRMEVDAAAVLAAQRDHLGDPQRIRLGGIRGIPRFVPGRSCGMPLTPRGILDSYQRKPGRKVPPGAFRAPIP